MISTMLRLMWLDLITEPRELLDYDKGIIEWLSRTKGRETALLEVAERKLSGRNMVFAIAGIGAGIVGILLPYPFRPAFIVFQWMLLAVMWVRILWWNSWKARQLVPLYRKQLDETQEEAPVSPS